MYSKTLQWSFHILKNHFCSIIINKHQQIRKNNTKLCTWRARSHSATRFCGPDRRVPYWPWGQSTAQILAPTHEPILKGNEVCHNPNSVLPSFSSYEEEHTKKTSRPKRCAWLYFLAEDLPWDIFFACFFIASNFRLDPEMLGWRDGPWPEELGRLCCETKIGRAPPVGVVGAVRTRVSGDCAADGTDLPLWPNGWLGKQTKQNARERHGWTHKKNKTKKKKTPWWNWQDLIKVNEVFFMPPVSRFEGEVPQKWKLHIS